MSISAVNGIENCELCVDYIFIDKKNNLVFLHSVDFIYHLHKLNHSHPSYLSTGRVSVPSTIGINNPVEISVNKPQDASLADNR